VVTSVKEVEVIRTVATKVRFRVTFEGGDSAALCLKGLLDVDEMSARGGPVTVREARFYDEIAPYVDVRVPERVTTIYAADEPMAIVIMRDLIAEGAHFCTALEAFTADEAALSLGQLARLHASRELLDAAPWIAPRLPDLAQARYVTAERLQELLDGSRGTGLSAPVRDAARLVAGMRALALRDAQRPQFLVHGDAHAGNIYRTAQGPGLIDWQLLQRGGWALDLGYHIAAVLPVEVAEAEERALLRHYLAEMTGLGCAMPGDEDAWQQYREAALYGFYLWSITQRVEPAIIDLFVGRLGAAVTRHQSHRLLGV
jgi:aminoglycoside phosphotransferase (APT) family kinase protein